MALSDDRIRRLAEIEQQFMQDAARREAAVTDNPRSKSQPTPQSDRRLPAPSPTNPGAQFGFPNYRPSAPFDIVEPDPVFQDWLNATGGGGGSGGGSGGVRAQSVSFTPIATPGDVTFDPFNVDRSLYQLEETAAERQALADARADIDARARAGAQAIINTWQAVEQTNRQAAERARELAVQYGTDAASLWSSAANQAREASVLRAAAVMANEGRAPIDLDPMAGGGAFISAMESLIRPEAERAFAEGQMQAERSEWAADLSQAQSAAYQGELQRTALIMASDMAREHNARVLERISRERLALSDAESQAGMFNRQMQTQVDQSNIDRRLAADQFNAQMRQSAEQFNAQMRQAAASAASSRGTSMQQQLSLLEQALGISAMTGDTSILRQSFPNLSADQAQGMVENLQALRAAGVG